MTAVARTAHDAFLEAIIAAPGDDTPRLVYADWLEEHGEGERAEFIRVQIVLSSPEGVRVKCGRTKSRPECSDPECRWCFYRRRERSLLCHNFAKWNPLPPDPHGDVWDVTLRRLKATASWG